MFTSASSFIEPVLGRRLRSHHRAFGPSAGDRFMNGFVEAAGRSHSEDAP